MKKTRKLLTMIAMIVFLVSTVTTYALAECNESQYVISGEADFILTSTSGRIIGIKSICEDVEWLDKYQHANVRFPANVEDKSFVRFKGLSKVMFDGPQMIQGGSSLHVTISIYPDKINLVKECVAELLGCDVDTVHLTANNIVAATIYRQQLCEVNSMAGHIFFVSGTDRQPVGTITFNNGQSVTLYYGHLDGRCEKRLGFAPGWYSSGGKSGGRGSSGKGSNSSSGSGKVKITVEEHTEMQHNQKVTIEISGKFDYSKFLEGLSSGGSSCGK